METKLYVGNLPFEASEDELKELFSQAGEVVSVTIIKDNYSGRSKGFGFIEMSSQEEVQNAINLLNGKDYQGRDLRVDLARPPQKRDDSQKRGGKRRY